MVEPLTNKEKQDILDALGQERHTKKEVEGIVGETSRAASSVLQQERETADVQGGLYDFLGHLNGAAERLVSKEKLAEIERTETPKYEQELREILAGEHEFLRQLREALSRLTAGGVFSLDELMKVYGEGLKPKNPVSAVLKGVAGDVVRAACQQAIEDPEVDVGELARSKEVLAGLDETLAKYKETHPDFASLGVLKVSALKGIERMLQIARAADTGGLSRVALEGLTGEVLSEEEIGKLSSNQEAWKILEKRKNEGKAALILLNGQLTYCYGSRGWSEVEKQLVDEKNIHTVIGARFFSNEETRVLVDGLKPGWGFLEVQTVNGESNQLQKTADGSLHKNFLKKAFGKDEVSDDEQKKLTERFLAEPLKYLAGPLARLALSKE